MTTSPSLPKSKCPVCGHGGSSKGRSGQQNRAYWLLIVTPLAEYLKLSSEETHDLLKHKFLREIHYVKRRDGMMEELVVSKSTTSLTTSDFENFCMHIRIWASELGCYLKEPNEADYEQANR